MEQQRVYIVPISGDRLSIVAMNKAIELMDKKKDKLYLITAIIEKHAVDAFAPFTDRLFPSHNEGKEANARAAMGAYLEKAKAAGVVDASSVVAFASNFADFIRKESQQRKADMVVVGPHMAPLGEWLRRHHVNVLTAAGEIPIDTRELEEQERSRRIQEHDDEMRGEEINAATARKVASHYTHYAEHEEQERRVRENTFRDVADLAARTAVKRDVDRAQNAEQQERVARDQFSATMDELVRDGNVRSVNEQELLEQQRRVNETILSNAAAMASRKAMQKAVVAATERERYRQMESPTFRERCGKSMSDLGISQQRPATPVLF